MAWPWKKREPPKDEPSQEDLLARLLSRFESVNDMFIRKVAEQIAKIGELNPSSMHILTIMASMNEDIAAINQELAKQLHLAIGDLYKLFNKALNDLYDSPLFRRALKLTPLSKQDKARLEHYAQTVARQTATTMENLSNTTVISGEYREAVDKAILATSSGMTDYKSATRDVLRKIGENGLQVEYESGYRRRLDTAVRQNVVNGAAQIAQHGSDLMGEALGYNAVQLSAHLHSAPDHEPVQGRIFLKEEFAKMQSGQDCKDIKGKVYRGFKRKIGEWNCMHLAMSFDTERSVSRYKEEDLQKWAEENAKGCMIDGKHYTLYQATQLMRRIETQVRREKDKANAARAAGDEELRQECQRKINALVRKYAEVAKAANLAQRKDRMRVEGFRRVKVTE